MSWNQESHRHAMAAKGVKTKYIYRAHGNPKLAVALPSYSEERIKHITSLSDEGQKEWIAEMIILNGEVIIDDIRPSEILDKSNLHWTLGDDKRDVGYIHYHPPQLIPEFSAQDFVLAINVHNLRTNKNKYPYTIMGLVYPDGNKLKVRLYGIKPKQNRIKQFEGLVATESDMKETLEKMKKSGELICMKEAIK